MSSPIIPRSRKNPTMSARRINRAFGVLNEKYEQLKSEIWPLIESLRTTEVNQNRSFIFALNELYSDVINERGTLYDFSVNVTYDVTSFEYQALIDRIDTLIGQILNEGGKRNLFFFDFIQEEGDQGTLNAFQNLANQSDLYAERVSLQQILQSQPYIQWMQITQDTSWYNWKSLGENTKKDLANVIQEGIARGVSTRELAGIISKRLDVSKSSARRIAQTDMLMTYREARLREDERAKEQYGIETKELWISALIPTTRKWHASRHGRCYTQSEVREFYSEVSNRVNCMCSVVSTVFIEGEPQISKVSQKKLNKEKDTWQSTYGK